MHTTHLRKVGGSVMMAVPPAILDLLHLQAGSKIELDIEGEKLVLKPQTRPRYTLNELLTRSGAKKRISKEDREWLDLAPKGREL
jgi:antitoxin ChpS